MTVITFNGTNSSFIPDGLVNATNDPNLDFDIISASATEVIIFNQGTGAQTVIAGTGFGVDAQGEPNSGTVTSLTFFSANGTVLEGSMTDISINLVALASALAALEDNDDSSLIAAIFNGNGPITINDETTSNGLDMIEMFGDDGFGISGFLPEVTQPITINGNDQDGVLVGGAGNDTINPGANSSDGDTIFGSAGNDVIDFTVAAGQSFYSLFYVTPAPVTVTIDGAANTGSVVRSDGTDTLLNVANTLGADGLGFVGSFGADTFDVTLGANQWMQLDGLDGADDFDLSIAANSIVRLSYTNSDFGIVADFAAGTILDGEFGNSTDTVAVTGEGLVELRGSIHNDSMTGSDRDERFITEQGNDTVDGGAGFDTVRYDRSGVDAVSVDLSLMTANASGVWNGVSFTDSLSNVEAVHGSREGDDTLSGSGADEYFFGSGGNDILNGMGGDDSLYGGTGNDTIDGGADNDTVWGFSGDDSINGGTGDDTLDGGANNDMIDGGADNDILLGGAGFDTLMGGSGDDSLDGQGNADRLYGDAGNDTIIGGEGTDNLYGGADNDRMFGGNGADRLFGDGGNDLIRAGSNFGSSVDGVEGGAGNDTIFGEGGYDLLLGGTGDDYIDGGNQADDLRGEDGNDTLDGGAGFDRLFGGNDDDLLMDFDGLGGQFGGSGNDTLLSGDDAGRFFGGGGNDSIEAGGGDDVISGGGGFDLINSGAGNDQIFGDFNADTFVFADGDGIDTIGDFDAFNGLERIDLSGVSAITSLADLNLGSASLGAATFDGADVVIDTGGSNSIRLVGVNISDLDASDFIF
jgi:Ca2+-binding RTX toxin-like protein